MMTRRARLLPPSTTALRIALLMVMAMLLAACTQPSPARQAQPQPSTGFPANPFDRPAPAQPIGTAAALPDRSCKTDADCTVKDVGNCCGYYPACVNVNARTDPQAVQARCVESGRVSVCGFPAISACQCVAGRCAADSRARIPAAEAR